MKVKGMRIFQSIQVYVSLKNLSRNVSDYYLHDNAILFIILLKIYFYIV